MAKRIGGRPDKKRLLPGLGYPIGLQDSGAPFEASGDVSLAGSIIPAGDILAELQAQGGDPAPLPHLGLLLATSAGGPFDLTPTAAASLAATLTASGTPALEIGLSGNASLASTISPYGVPALAIGLSGSAALAGAFSSAGTAGFFGPFESSGNVSLAGSFSAAGDVYSTIEFQLSGDASISAAFSSDAEPALGIGVSGSAGLSGSLSASGDTSYGDPFELDSPLEAAFSASFSAAGEVFVESAMAQGGDPAPLPHLGLLLAASGGAPFETSGSVVLSASFSADAEPDLSIALGGNASLSGAITPSGTPELGIAVGGSVSLAGSISSAGEFLSTIAFDIAGDASLASTFSASGEVFAPDEFQVSGGVALSGVISTYGDVGYSEEPVSAFPGFEVDVEPKLWWKSKKTKPEAGDSERTEQKHERRLDKVSAEVKERVRGIIEAAANSQVSRGTLPKSVRFAEVRSALKEYALPSGFNWPQLYERMYQQALTDAIRQELELEQAIQSKIQRDLDDDALALLLLEL